MNKFNRLFILLWDLDPGYIQLKRAIKTILAILITLWITRDHPRSILLIAGIGSGISMQGIAGKTFRQRTIQLVLFDISYLMAFMLGALVKDSIHLTALTLVFLGFAVNYIRRFNLEKSIAPMMFWLLCFFAIILPFSGTTQKWEAFQGLIIGLTVSAAVFLIVFPENYARLFILNTNRMFASLSVGLFDLRKQLLQKRARQNFENTAAFEQKELLTQLLESNQAISDHLATGAQSPMSQSLMQQYTLISAYKIILDAYQNIWPEKSELPRYLVPALATLNKNFASVCRSTTMKQDYTIHIKQPLVSLDEWTKKLRGSPLNDPNLVILLLNLKLGFQLLNKHLSKLLWQKNEA